ncbi:beta-hexosaminidase subunit alpha-like [Glandiceps talaboti]
MDKTRVPDIMVVSKYPLTTFSLALAFNFLICSAVIYPLAPRLAYNITISTPGTPWPLPQSLIVNTNLVYVLRQSRFEFVAVGITCDLLDKAFQRYRDIIFDEEESIVGIENNLLRQLEVEVTGTKGCEKYPGHESIESYTLSIEDGVGSLRAEEVWGVLRGLETFSQMIYQLDDDKGHEYYIKDSAVDDFPRYKYRGIMLDTARHFMPMDTVRKNLDAMAYNKFNVLHWHIVDDQAFPYQSKTFPEMSEKGAYDPVYKVYTQRDVAEVIEYSRLRGIRVIPEFDTPRHMDSWGKGIPNLLTECWANGKPSPPHGPINPILNSTYDFLKQFFSEIVDVFPDTHVHLGADEVSYACWQSNPDIQEFMDTTGWGDDYHKLEEYYNNKLFDIVTDLGAQYIIWQDPIDSNVTVNDQTVVEVWKDTELWSIFPPFQESLEKVTKLGLQTILSACWYLNYIDYGPNWEKFYLCEPTDFTGTEEQKNLIIGGEACIWAEYVDGSNVVSRLWPRASAVGERLWSAKDVTDLDDAALRLDQQRCRMVRRGIQAQPISPGYCGKYEVDMDGKMVMPVDGATSCVRSSDVITVILVLGLSMFVHL